ncbi:DNA/RNA polymerases superfamily protein [Tanacetum coccineum]
MATGLLKDRLTKSAHFLPIRKDYPVSKIAEMFQQEIVRLHGTPSSIVSDRDPRFTSLLWKGKCDDYNMSSGVFAYNNSGKRAIDALLSRCCMVTNEKVAVAREKLKEALTHQKSYADRHRRALEFVFIVSLLRGYKYHPLHVVSYPFDQIREDLSYTEEPESILDRQDRVMRNKTIPFVKILWRNHPEREATWETEESIRTSYPHFLP